MAREIGGVFVNWKTNIASFLSDIDKAQVKSTAAGVFIANQLTKATDALVRMAADAATALPRLVQSSIDVADQINKTSQKIGIAAESLSFLQHAATLSDTPIEVLTASIAKLNKQAAAAADGSKKQAALFREIGVAVEDSAGKIRPAEEILMDVAEVFAGMPDGVQKTALAMDLFGKTGAQLIPFLNQGKAGLAALKKEAEELGLIIDTKTAQAAEEFNDNLTRIQGAARGLGNAMAAELLPQFVAVSQAAVDFAKSGGIAGDVAKFMGETFAFLASNTVALAAYFQSVLITVKEVDRLILLGLNKIGVVSDAKLNEFDIGLQKAHDRFNALADLVAKLQRSGDVKLPDFKTGGGKDLGGGGLSEEAQKIADRFQKALNPASDLNKELQEIAAQGGTTGQILAAYGEEIVKAVEEQKAHGQAVPAFIASLGAIAKATQDTKEAMASYVGTQDLARQSNGLWLESIARSAKAPVQVADALSQLDATNKRIIAGFQEKVAKVTEAYDLLGLKAPAELQKIADASKAAYDASGLAAERGTKRELTARLAMLEAQREAVMAAGRTWTEEQEKMVKAAEASIEKFNEKLEKTEEVGQEVGRVVGNAIEEIAFHFEGLRSLLSHILDQLAQFVLQLTVIGPLQKRIAEWFNTGTGGGGGGGGGWLGALLGSIGSIVGGVFGGGGAAAAAAPAFDDGLPLVGTFFAGLELPPLEQAFMPEGVMPSGEITAMPVEEMVRSGELAPQNNSFNITQNLTVNGGDQESMQDRLQQLLEMAHDSAVRTAVNIMTEMQLRRA